MVPFPLSLPRWRLSPDVACLNRVGLAGPACDVEYMIAENNWGGHAYMVNAIILALRTNLLSKQTD